MSMPSGTQKGPRGAFSEDESYSGASGGARPALVPEPGGDILV
jgi:hypothetical protein